MDENAKCSGLRLSRIPEHLTKKAFKDQTLSERKQSKFLVFKVMIKTGMAGFLIIFGGCSWMQTGAIYY
ncbi:hypothetical protein FE784_18455 [Paenibacillus hemerocallicola]|uniref:Uncharacterized protein n=1 Tax=Paenibacillus hemerocallicola TaxID=1172614 RepID=A0A5C4T901_9BACL|nr:hypothetical protein [Paenibacillus hemerocallicola]TNJ64829.1 hypothetical protein FE784_18455 [Paenibacillus hemerocallicola]